MDCTCKNEIYPFSRIKNSDTMVVYDAFYFLRGDKYRKNLEALKAELFTQGIQLDRIQQSVLWRHVGRKECDVRKHAHMLLEEMKPVKYILFAGAEVTQVFFNKKVSDLYGLKVESDIIGKDKLVVVAPSITTINSAPIGEFRDAIRFFANERRNHDAR